MCFINSKLFHNSCLLIIIWPYFNCNLASYIGRRNERVTFQNTELQLSCLLESRSLACSGTSGRTEKITRRASRQGHTALTPWLAQHILQLNHVQLRSAAEMGKSRSTGESSHHCVTALNVTLRWNQLLLNTSWSTYRRNITPTHHRHLLPSSYLAACCLSTTKTFTP